MCLWSSQWVVPKFRFFQQAKNYLAAQCVSELFRFLFEGLAHLTVWLSLAVLAGLGQGLAGFGLG